MLNIYIPRVYKNINERRILSVFFELNFGFIEKIKIIPHDNKFNSVYVYFKYWHDDENSQTVYSTLDAGESVKIMYDSPWFWIVKACKYTPPYIDFSYKEIVKRTPPSYPPPRRVRNKSDSETIEKLQIIKNILKSMDPMIVGAIGARVNTLERQGSKSV